MVSEAGGGVSAEAALCRTVSVASDLQRERGKRMAGGRGEA